MIVPNMLVVRLAEVQGVVCILYGGERCKGCCGQVLTSEAAAHTVYTVQMIRAYYVIWWGLLALNRPGEVGNLICGPDGACVQGLGSAALAPPIHTQTAEPNQ